MVERKEVKEIRKHQTERFFAYQKAAEKMSRQQKKGGAKDELR